MNKDLVALLATIGVISICWVVLPHWLTGIIAFCSVVIWAFIKDSLDKK